MSLQVENRLGNNSQFFTSDGWIREPLFVAINQPPEIAKVIFVPPDSNLSFTLCLIRPETGVEQYLTEDIGCRNYSTFEQYFTQTLERCQSLVADFRFGTMKVIEINLRIFPVMQELAKEFKDRNIPLNKVAHSRGLMVLKSYSGKGYANMLQKEADQTLINKGIRAFTAFTTNKISARVFEKNKYRLVKSYYYKTEFNIDLDDTFCIWVKFIGG